MSRIRSNMSPEERSKRLSNEDSGDAFEICMEFARIGSNYSLELLDEFDITGALITQLFNVCGHDIVKTAALLQACKNQTDGLTQAKLMHAIKNRSAGINVAEIIAKAIKKSAAS